MRRTTILLGLLAAQLIGCSAKKPVVTEAPEHVGPAVACCQGSRPRSGGSTKGALGQLQVVFCQMPVVMKIHDHAAARQGPDLDPRLDVDRQFDFADR